MSPSSGAFPPGTAPEGIERSLALGGPTAGRSSPLKVRQAPRSVGSMCRNITALRGLEPPATDEEIQAAALQFVRKVAGVQSVSASTRGPIDAAVAEIAASVTRLLADLPERRQPPSTVPPLRRAEVRARIAAREAADAEHERAHTLGLVHEH